MGINVEVLTIGVNINERLKYSMDTIPYRTKNVSQGTEENCRKLDIITFASASASISCRPLASHSVIHRAYSHHVDGLIQPQRLE
jgi:hypothetical protein